LNNNKKIETFSANTNFFLVNLNVFKDEDTYFSICRYELLTLYDFLYTLNCHLFYVDVTYYFLQLVEKEENVQNTYTVPVFYCSLFIG